MAPVTGVPDKGWIDRGHQRHDGLTVYTVFLLYFARKQQYSTPRGTNFEWSRKTRSHQKNARSRRDPRRRAFEALEVSTGSLRWLGVSKDKWQSGEHDKRRKRAALWFLVGESQQPSNFFHAYGVVSVNFRLLSKGGPADEIINRVFMDTFEAFL